MVSNLALYDLQGINQPCLAATHPFQAYYMNQPFPVEVATTSQLPFPPTVDPNKAAVEQLADYPVRGLVLT